MRRLPHLSTHFVLGYTGCDREIGEAAVHGAQLAQSNNPYDWLGTGVYFWEGDPDRALSWAQEEAAIQRQRLVGTGSPMPSIRWPFAIGAVINPGTCFDL